MRAYMAFSRIESPTDGAILVIANTAKEARKMAYRSGDCWNVDKWTDQAVRWLRDSSIFGLADQLWLSQNKPHIIISPTRCTSCGTWGAGIYNGRICYHCDNFAGDELVKCLTAV